MRYLEIIKLKAQSVHSSMHLGTSTIMYLRVTVSVTALSMAKDGNELGLMARIQELNQDETISLLPDNIIH